MRKRKRRKAITREAINLYEAALDGSPTSAEVHYKLALIYDDKMNDPLNALHHFKRFLALEPSEKRAQEVKEFHEARRADLAHESDRRLDGAAFRSWCGCTTKISTLRQQIGERLGGKEGGERGVKSAAPRERRSA